MQYRASTVAVCVMFALATPPARADTPTTELVVSTDGNDAWSGKLAQPNTSRTDGPFATLARAQQAARAIKHVGGHASVLVRKGTYALDAPLRFDPRDSGSRWAAWPGERVVISGGVQILGWTRASDGTWRTRLPADVPFFSQLYIDDERRTRARVPKQGYLSALSADSNWQAPDDIEVLAFHQWTVSRARAVVKRGKLELAKPLSRPSTRYVIENVREALDEGDWYFDRATRELIYRARGGEDLSRAVVIAPRLTRLVEMRGDAVADRFVEDVELRGFHFAHVAWNTPADGHEGTQAEIAIDAAITVAKARDVAFAQIEVAHTGGYAIAIAEGSQRVRVLDSTLYDLGAGGIKIGETTIATSPASQTTQNVVRNCRIIGGGRVHPGAVAIWIGQSSWNEIRSNEIADFYYSGISIGWTWGTGHSAARWNLIENNDIHDIGQGVLDDLGAIYTLGRSFGTTLRHNRIRRVSAWRYGGWGIYLDEGSSGITAENNLIQNCESANVYQNYGSDNWVINNILAFGEQAQVGHGASAAGLTLERNIVYFAAGSLLSGSWDKGSFDQNAYWRTQGRPFDFAGRSLVAWQQLGRDVHGLIANPVLASGPELVIEPRLAARIRFVPFDTTHFGPSRTTADAPSLPRTFSARPVPVASEIAEGFETTAIDVPASAATTAEESGTRARVTDQAAASGRHSLRLEHGANAQAREWLPYVAYDPGLVSGAVEASFAIRVERGSLIEHQWRDDQLPYRIGPALRIHGDGTLEASGRAIAKVPLGSWIRVSIRMALGEEADGTWQLGIALPGETIPTWTRSLPCDKGFHALRWFAFLAHGPAASTAYIDDITVKPRN